MDLQLQEKSAIITGGAKGIGEAICRTLAAEGAKVAIFDRDVETATRLVEELSSEGKTAAFFEVDLTDLDACEKACAKALEWLGNELHCLVNNAGINDGAGLEHGPQPFLTSLERNLHHVYAMAHYCLPALKKAQGSILNITSKVATTGQGQTSGYAAAKGAVNGLTREWALELAPHHVRVNAIAPAEVYTPLYESWLASQDNPEETLMNIQAQVPLGHRMTTAQEIANLSTFLLSPCSSHTTGQILYPDGGYTHLDRSCTSALLK